MRRPDIQRAAMLDQACKVCERFCGCRGECPGLPDDCGRGIPPECFEAALNRHGGVDPETGDLADWAKTGDGIENTSLHGAAETDAPIPGVAVALKLPG